MLEVGIILDISVSYIEFSVGGIIYFRRVAVAVIPTV